MRSRLLVVLSAASLCACEGNVAGGNSPPSLNPPGALTLDEGKTQTVELSASDPDGDSLTLSLTSAPAFVTLSERTLTLAPGFSDSGAYTVRVQVSDGTATADGSLELTVTNVNRPPALDALAAVMMDAGAMRTVSVAATDPDGDTVTLALDAAPSWATLSGSTITLAPPAAGDATITVSASDGQLSATRSFDVHVAPLSSTVTGTLSIEAGAQYTRSATVTLTLTAMSTAGTVTQMRFSNDGVTFSPFEAFAATRAAWPLDAPGADGTKTVTVELMDSAGATAQVSDTIVLDGTPPSLGSATINGGATWARSTSVTVAAAGASDAAPGSGLAQLCISGAGAAPSPQCQPYGTGSAAFTLSSGDGPKTLDVYVVDGVGLPSATRPANVGLDATPPVLTSIDLDSGATSTLNPLLSIASVASDGAGGSGVTDIAFAEDSGAFGAWLTWSSGMPNAFALAGGNGAHTVHAKVRDAAGNESGEATDTITLSGAPPSGSFVIGSGDPPYTRTGTVTLVINASAATHWCANETGTPPSSATDPCWTLLSSTSFDLSMTDGPKTVSMWFKDSAGAISSMPATDTITLDATPPTVTISASMLGIAQGATYTTSLSPAFDHSASDATSGLLDVCTGLADPPTNCVAWTAAPALALAVGDGTQTGYLVVHDRAGNASAVLSDTITLDRTAPTLTSISVNGGASSATSPMATVTLTGASDGAGSGLASVELSNDGATFTAQPYAASVTWTLASGDGTKTVTARLVDAAGNRSVMPWPADDILLDQGAPTATLDVNGGQRYANTATVPLTITPSEPTTGMLQAIVVQLASASPPPTPSTFGAFTSPATVNIGGTQGDKKIYAWLKDAAGNVSPGPAVYLIAYDTVAPAVSAPSPANGATGVSRGARPAVTFNEPLDPASVGASSLTVSGVTGTVAYDAASSRVYFVPSMQLAASTTYTVTVSGVRDRAGNALAAPYTFSFSTGTLLKISSDTAPGFTAPSIVTNSAGTLMMWSADDGLPTNDKAALYWAFHDGTSWRTGILGRGGAAQVLTWGANQFAATWSTGCCTRVLGLFDPVSATWSLQSPPQGTVFGARSTRLYDLVIPATGNISGHFFDTTTRTWTSVTQQASPVGTGYVPAAGTATTWAVEYLSFIAGSTYAVWLQRNTGGTTWQTIQLTNTTGFPSGLGLVSNGTTLMYTYLTTAVIESGQSVDVGGTAILSATDGAGFLVAGYASGVLTARVSNGTTWSGGAAAFSAPVASLVTSTVKATGASGHWALTWMQGTDLMGAVFDGTSWSAPATIALGSMTSPLSGVSQASLGANHLVAWTQDSESWASGWDGTRWTAPVKLNTQARSGPHTVGTAGGALAAFFGQGAAMVVRTWQPVTGFAAPSTIVNSQVIGACNNYQGWGPPVSVAFAPGGTGLATWAQYDAGHWTVRAAYYDGTSWGAPFVVQRDALLPRVATNGTTWVISWMRATPSGGQLSGIVAPWTPAGGVGAVTDLGGLDYGAQLASDGAGFMAAMLKGNSTDVMVASSSDGVTWTTSTIEPAVMLQGWSNVSLSGSSLGYALAYKPTGSGLPALARTYSAGAWSASAPLLTDGTCVVASGSATHAALCRSSSTLYTGYVLAGSSWGATSFGSVSGGGLAIASAGPSFRVAFGGGTRLYTTSWGAPETTGTAPGPAIGASAGEYATIGLVTSNGFASVRAASSSGGVMVDRGFLEAVDGAAYSPVVAGTGTGFWGVWSQDDVGGSNSIYGTAF